MVMLNVENELYTTVHDGRGLTERNIVVKVIWVSTESITISISHQNACVNQHEHNNVI